MALDFFTGWEPIALAAVTLSLLAVGAVYAIGAIFDAERLKGWAKTEFLQVMASGILVAGLLVFATALNTTATTVAGQDHIQYAENYLADLNLKLGALYLTTFAFNTVIATLADVDLEVSIIVAGAKVKPFAGFGAISQQLSAILFGIFIAITSNAVQYNFLQFIDATMMYYFLPIGVILRSFNPTRSVGALFMALAIGLYFVFPLTFVLASTTVGSMNQHIVESTVNMDQFKNQATISQDKLTDVQALSALITSFAANLWTLPGEIVTALVKVILADIFMQVLILPAIGIAITYVFIQQLARLLGAYVDIGSWWLFT